MATGYNLQGKWSIVKIRRIQSKEKNEKSWIVYDFFLAYKAGEFRNAKYLDVETDRELGRVKKWFEERGWRVKIR